ncbi:VOC family protein [Streptomyces sp. MST-110588]|uniref:VOC family protein n=1 Tax=Streptomyces sp. MST-110588 TaxID=2833628 RepID=UPI001F5C7C36|nr:VOC family protein [Streptomyces sp. MST-110588]UNO38842.1 VOC family protein [Streptomyces sp. MST-110588]
MVDKQMACIPGAPSWVSLMTGDLDTAMEFYGSLLGWEFRSGPERWGPYVRATASGTPVAGLSASAHHTELPVSWTMYFGTEDADATAAGLRERGGTVAVGPLNFDAGRLALAADPAGARFGLWECRNPGAHGYARPQVDGAPTWVELRTRDAFEAARFYGGMFCWDEQPEERYAVRWEDDRVVLRVAGRDAVGLYGGAVEAAADPQIRPRWNVHFQVPDAQAAVETTRKLGGTVVSGPAGTAHGQVAELRDPQGALFHVIAPGG